MPPTQDRHAQRREQSRERLMDAAVEMLEKSSYADIRIEDITGRARMAKGSFYMHFKGKDELYTQLFDRFMSSQFIESFENIEAVDDPRRALRDIIGFTIDQIEPGPEIMFIYRAVMDPSLLKLIRPHMEEFMQRYVGALRNYFERLGRGRDAEMLAYLLGVLLDGLWFYRIMEMEPQELSAGSAARKALKEKVFSLFDL